MTPNSEKLKQVQNTFYYIVQRVKRECWQKFLAGDDELDISDAIKSTQKTKTVVEKLYSTLSPGQTALPQHSKAPITR